VCYFGTNPSRRQGWILSATVGAFMRISHPSTPLSSPPLTRSSQPLPVTGTINVVPGDHLTGIPDFRFKRGGEYRITDPWKFGLSVFGNQYLVGDESIRTRKYRLIGR
jgi:hypothetical protein